jgi:hypothetical protein
LQAFGTGFALAQLEQVGNLLSQLYRLINMLGGDQAAAFGLPALAEGVQYAVAPFAARYQCHGAAHAVIPGAARHFAGFVFSGQAELEQLGWAFAAGVAVVQGQGGDRQLLTITQLFDQVLFQRTDHQLNTSGLGLAVEVIHRGQARAVEYFDARRVLSCLLRLEVRSHKAVTQGASDGSQLAVLWQQQCDFS